MKRDTISSWIDNWQENGIKGLYDKPRKGATPKINEEDRVIAFPLCCCPSEVRGDRQKLSNHPSDCQDCRVLFYTRNYDNSGS